MEPAHSAGSQTDLGEVLVDAVDKTFHTRRGDLVPALRGVSLHVRPGEFVSLVGPSGCGKSTLLKIVAGLEPASLGRVEIDGSAVDGPRRSVGMMFQTPELFPWRNVIENALLPIDVFREVRSAHVARAQRILDLVGLSGFERSRPHELSGGMQQRVALSRMLMADPAVMLLDEPFGALDEFTRERLNLELLRVWDDARKTLLFVTHNIGEAVFLSDRVAVMGTKPGRILADISVNLPRPRSLDLIRERAYLDLVFQVRSMLGVAH